MNSIDKHLSAATIAATLLAMRSAKKEIFLVVEGDSDVRLFSHLLGIPSSNIVSCNGKGNLTDLFDLEISKGLDEGTVFIRDRDHDQVNTSIINGRLLLVTKHYDVELDLLVGRIFQRLYSEFSKNSHDSIEHHSAWKSILTPASAVGALRLVSIREKLNINFENMKISKFLDIAGFQISVKSMIDYFFSRSQCSNCKEKTEIQVIEKIEEISADHLSCGKDVIEFIEIAFSRYFRFCNKNECTSDTISRIIRVSSTFDDFKNMDFFPIFRDHVTGSSFNWSGFELA